MGSHPGAQALPLSEDCPGAEMAEAGVDSRAPGTAHTHHKPQHPALGVLCLLFCPASFGAPGFLLGTSVSPPVRWERPCQVLGGFSEIRVCCERALCTEA